MGGSTGRRAALYCLPLDNRGASSLSLPAPAHRPHHLHFWAAAAVPPTPFDMGCAMVGLQEALTCPVIPCSNFFLPAARSRIQSIMALVFVTNSELILNCSQKCPIILEGKIQIYCYWLGHAVTIIYQGQASEFCCVTTYRHVSGDILALPTTRAT